MSRLLRFTQLTIITVAVLLMVVLFGRAFVTMYWLLQRVVEDLGVAKLLDYTLVAVLIVGILMLLYFVAVRKTIVQKVQNWLNANASEADDYKYVAGVWAEQSASASSINTQSVMVYLNGGWQPALLIERTVTGAYVVYVPQVPNARSGAIYVVESFQVSPLNIPTHEMQKIIRHVGKGLAGHTSKLFEVG